MREFHGTSTDGNEITAEITEHGTLQFMEHHTDRANWSITLDAASVAKLRDWLAEDCCDMRRAKDA